MITIRTKAASQLHAAITEAREQAQQVLFMLIGILVTCRFAENKARCRSARSPIFCTAGMLSLAPQSCAFDILKRTQIAANTRYDFNRFLVSSKRVNAPFQVLKDLAVSGAFHTGLMQPVIFAFDCVSCRQLLAAKNIAFTACLLQAQSHVAAAVREAKLGAARLNVYSNYSGKVYPRKPSLIRQHIIRQLNYPVKWEQIMQLIYRKHQVSSRFSLESLALQSTRLQDYNFPTFYELGPGRQLGAILFQVSKKAFKTYKSFGNNS